MGTEYIVEVSAAGASQTAADLKNVADAEQQIADAAKLAATAASASAEVITTSTQKISQAQEQGRQKSEAFNKAWANADYVVREKQKERNRAAARQAAVKTEPEPKDEPFSIGKFALSGTALVAAGVKYVSLLRDASRERERSEKESAAWMQNITRTTAADPAAGLQGAQDRLSAINAEQNKLGETGLISSAGEYVKFELGLNSEIERGLQLEKEKAAVLGQRGAAMSASISLVSQETDIIETQISGERELAELKTRQLADEQEMARLRQVTGPIKDADLLSSSGRKALEMEGALRAKQAAREEAFQKASSKGDADSLTDLRGKATALELIAEHREREAAALQRILQLSAEMHAVDAKGGSEEVRDQKKQALLDAYSATERRTAQQNAAADKQKIEIADDLKDAAGAQLAGETAAAQIAIINKRLKREIADITENETPEEAAKLIPIKEQTAELRRQYALKLEQQKDEEEARSRKEVADKNSAADSARDTVFRSQKLDGEILVKIADARARGEDDIAAKLEIEGGLLTKLASIYQSALTPAQQALLAGLAEEEAALKRIAASRAKVNAAVDAKIADNQKTPQQRSEEKDAAKRKDSGERAVISQRLDEEDRKTAQARGKQRTPAEREARRQELFGERGLDEHGRKKKPDSLDAAAKELEEAKGEKLPNLAPKPDVQALKGPADPLAGLPNTTPQGDVTTPKSVNTQPVSDALDKAAESIVKAVADAIKSGQQPDLSPISDAIDSVRSDLQSQIDNLRTG